jgi:outer membrane protein TolC
VALVSQKKGSASSSTGWNECRCVVHARYGGWQTGAIDLLSVLVVQVAQIASQADVIKLRNAQLANCINLHLALGGSFDAAPATKS